jgi:putative effector of murein hydrolase
MPPKHPPEASAPRPKTVPPRPVVSTVALTDDGSSDPTGVVTLVGPHPRRELAVGFALLLAWATLFYVMLAPLGFGRQHGLAALSVALVILAGLGRAGKADRVSAFMRPSVQTSLRWMPVLFAPPLARLVLDKAPRLASSVGSALLFAALAIVCWLVSLCVTAWVVRGLETVEELGWLPKPPPKPQPDSDSPFAPLRRPMTLGTGAAPLGLDERERDRRRAVLATGVAAGSITAVMLMADRLGDTVTQSFVALGLGVGAWGGYAASLLLPAGLRRLVHPILPTTLVVSLLTWALGGTATDGFAVMEVVFARLVPVAIVALGFQLFDQRRWLVGHGMRWGVGLVVAVLSALFLSAVTVRLLPGDNATRAAFLLRSVTTPIALPAVPLLGADAGLTAAIVMLLGVFGANVGPMLLDRLGFHDALSRGIAIGVNAHAVGTVSVAQTEPPVAAISTVTFVAGGGLVTLLVAWPEFREALLLVAGL